MADKLLDIHMDDQQLAKIKIKLDKYPPFVIEEGLNSVNTFLNSDTFKTSMYPESHAGEPRPHRQLPGRLPGRLARVSGRGQGPHRDRGPRP